MTRRAVILLCLFACGDAPQDGPAAAADAGPAEFEWLDVPGTIAPQRSGDVYFAGQPLTAGFETYRDGGVRTVITLRHPDEPTGIDEPAVVERLGFEYHVLPFSGADQMTDELLDEVRAIVNDEDKRPVLIHCASGNRVGAVWMAHRMVDAGLSAEEARAEAETIGLRSDALAERAVEYASRRSGG